MSFSAAECARLTGLTVRALRVYERYGLLKPVKSAKGWRLYGPEELQRINVIVTLKTFGMTLKQIRSLLATTPPPLAHVLDLQLRVCRDRRDEAQHAFELTQIALEAVESGQSLTLDELCNLTRSMKMGNHQAVVRELINERITPDEERAYMSWMATRPLDEVKAMQEYGAAVHVLFHSLQELRKNKVEPDAPETQALINEWNALAVRYRLRGFMTTLLEWNPAVAQKWLQLGESAISRSLAPQQAARDEDLWAYFGAAQAASPWHQALEQAVNEASRLAESTMSPLSAPALVLANRISKICSDHSLGDPLVYARWAASMQFRKSPAENTRRKAAWEYISDILQNPPKAS